MAKPILLQDPESYGRRGERGERRVRRVERDEEVLPGRTVASFEKHSIEIACARRQKSSRQRSRVCEEVRAERRDETTNLNRVNRRREEDVLTKKLGSKRKKPRVEFGPFNLGCCDEDGGEEERRGRASVGGSVEERVELTGELIVTGVETERGCAQR